ncbi:porin family protein [uncultured Prevotella sp.]|uniref:porin family protein n=1 Tax=uncultured Prevotella sp. TaxID=159272 RepID=UPI00258D1C83|nr:porin family protein [uncultured Prevotella sp.]
MMKKFLVAIVAVLFAAPSFAQYSSGGFSLSESTVYYGARVGLNVGWISGDVDGYGAKAGMNIGGVLGLRVSDATPVFLESGLYFAMQGAKDGKNEINLNYLEIPLLIKYGVQVTDDIALLPYLGPTFGLGIAGKTKYPGEGSVGSFSSDGDFNRPDVGIKFGCGAEYNKLYLETGLKFGVTNILDDDNDAAHNGAWYLNFGVNF